MHPCGGDPRQRRMVTCQMYRRKRRGRVPRRVDMPLSPSLVLGTKRAVRAAYSFERRPGCLASRSRRTCVLGGVRSGSGSDNRKPAPRALGAKRRKVPHVTPAKSMQFSAGLSCRQPQRHKIISSRPSRNCQARAARRRRQARSRAEGAVGAKRRGFYDAEHSSRICHVMGANTATTWRVFSDAAPA